MGFSVLSIFKAAPEKILNSVRLPILSVANFYIVVELEIFAFKIVVRFFRAFARRYGFFIVLFFLFVVVVHRSSP